MVEVSNDIECYSAKSADAEFVKAGIKGLVGMIPVVGTLLNEVLFEAMGRIHLARLEETVREVAARLERLEDGKVDEGRMETEEFADFVEALILNAMRTRSSEKRAIFADLLVASIHKDAEVNYDFAEEYVDLLARISEPEMIILGRLYEFAVHAQKGAEEGVLVELPPIDYEEKSVWGIPTKTFRVCFETLISKGLVFDDSFGRMDTRGRTFIMPTELAVAFLDFVRSSQSLIRTAPVR